MLGLLVADFTAILMPIPMLITAISSTHLKERVPIAGWLLLAGGLVGALVVIRPGTHGFQWGMLLSLGCVAFSRWDCPSSAPYRIGGWQPCWWPPACATRWAST